MRGPKASMEGIASAAGLGVGTLYRHFPDRQALLEHIATDALRRLLESSRAAVAEDRPRWEVLRQIVDRCVELPLALTNALTTEDARGRERVRLAREHDDLLEGLVAQAQDEGVLRCDIPARGVVELIRVAVCRPGAGTDDHLVTVVLDGLGAPSPGHL